MPSFPCSSKLPWKPLARLSHAHHWFSPRVLCLLVTQVLTVVVLRLLFMRELFSTHSCVKLQQLFLSHMFQTFSLFWTSSFSTYVGYDLSQVLASWTNRISPSKFLNKRPWRNSILTYQRKK